MSCIERIFCRPYRSRTALEVEGQFRGSPLNKTSSTDLISWGKRLERGITKLRITYVGEKDELFARDKDELRMMLVIPFASL